MVNSWKTRKEHRASFAGIAVVTSGALAITLGYCFEQLQDNCLFVDIGTLKEREIDVKNVSPARIDKSQLFLYLW